MEQSRTLLIEVPSHQLRRDLSARTIARDFKLEVTASPEDFVNERDELFFTGMYFRLTRPQYPHLSSSVEGYISAKKRLIPIDKERFSEKMAKLKGVCSVNNYDEKRFMALIAFEGIFRRDFELRIFIRKGGMQIRLRSEKSVLGKCMLTPIQTLWMKLKPTEASMERALASKQRLNQ